MPIRTATIGRQRTLSGLAKALFDRSGGVSQAEAEAALLRANPHLATEAGFTSGGRVIVPDLPGRIAGATAPPPDGGELIERVAQALAGLSGDAMQALDTALGEAKENAAAVRDRTFVALVGRGRPDLAPRLEEIQKAAREDLEALAARGEGLRAALDQAAVDLKAALARG